MVKEPVTQEISDLFYTEDVKDQRLISFTVIPLELLSWLYMELVCQNSNKQEQLCPCKELSTCLAEAVSRQPTHGKLPSVSLLRGHDPRDRGAHSGRDE